MIKMKFFSRSRDKLGTDNILTYSDISRLSRTYQLFFTHLVCRKRTCYEVSNLWNLLQNSFDLLLLKHVRVHLKLEQYLLENTDRVKHSLSNNNQDNNQDKSFSVSLSLTCDHPVSSTSSGSKSTPSLSVVSNNSSLTCVSLPLSSPVLFWFPPASSFFFFGGLHR